MRNNIIGVFVFLLGNLVFSCTDTETENVRSAIVKPGIYSTDIVLSAESGTESGIARGLDPGEGQFTNEYPLDYIYIHSADSKTEEEGHKSLRVDLKDVEFCNGCRGIHLEMEVLENEEGYVLSNSKGETMELGIEEKVYFSTIPETFWKAQVIGTTPVSERDVFEQTTANDEELLRSSKEGDYAVEDLITLLETPQPQIEMKRHCTGFRVYFMFTDMERRPNIDEWDWADYLDNTQPSDFYIKLYIGPHFCHQFDVFRTTTVDGDQGGFYVTNNQVYQPFGLCEASNMDGVTGTNSYRGYGYMTELGQYLLSPLNDVLVTTEPFSIYTFVKFARNGEGIDINTDVNAKYFQAVVEGFNIDLNKIHFIVMLYDLRDLQIFINEANGTTTENSYVRNAWSGNGPEKIDIKPIKIIYQ